MLGRPMSGRIPHSFIDDLVARADIVEVIGRRVSLVKAGRDYKAPCPFHDEKTPSFTVSAQKGFYHCFGCGAHGTAIGFLMNYENLDFVDAVEALAEMLGVEVPREAGSADRQRRDDGGLYRLLAEADRIYRGALKSDQRAVNYLKDRGLVGLTAKRFAMGYAPDSWDTVLRALGTDETRKRQLLEAGLTIRNEQGKEYDRFRDRIMFPIRDPRGRVIGFGDRLLGEGEPKYMNSPETPVFHKGRALYGLYEARQRGPAGAGRPDEILVVEGYLDVASLAQHGIGPAVATLGTATTIEHIRYLTRIARRVIFCFDGDRAGRKAAWRALETALPHAGGQVELMFLLLPEGEDPDSLVRSGGAEAFHECMDAAVPLSEFMLGELRSQVDLSSADGRSRLAALARPLLSRLPAGVWRELLIGQIAETIGVGVGALERELEKPIASPPPAGGRTGQDDAGRAADRSRGTLVRRAIGLVLNYPAIVAKLAGIPDLSSVEQPGAQLLHRLLQTVVENPEIVPAQLLERFRDDSEGRYLGRLLDNAPLDTEDAAAEVLQEMLRRIVAEDRKRRLQALLSRPSLSSEERADIAEIQNYLRNAQGNSGGP